MKLSQMIEHSLFMSGFRFVYFFYLATLFIMHPMAAQVRDIWAPIEPSENVIFRGRDGAGMFALFNDVLSLLQHFDIGYFQSIKVDLDCVWYQNHERDNWWENYFEPIELSKASVSIQAAPAEYSHLYTLEIPETYNPKEYNNYLIKKFIKIKSYVMEKIDSFLDKNFTNHFVFGVHYRGTDKGGEAPRVSFEVVEKVLREKISKVDSKNIKVFVASDEPEFITFLMNQFPGMIISFHDQVKHRHGYESGETALIDCILLSKTDFLIRTSSTLSLVSTFFNPKIPVYNLSERRPGAIPYHNPYTGQILSHEECLIHVLESVLGTRESLQCKAGLEENL